MGCSYALNVWGQGASVWGSCSALKLPDAEPRLHDLVSWEPVHCQPLREIGTAPGFLSQATGTAQVGAVGSEQALGAGSLVHFGAFTVSSATEHTAVCGS